MITEHAVKAKTIADLGDCEYQFIQCRNDVDRFNTDYDQDYPYYAIEWNDGIAVKLFGLTGFRLTDKVYFVTDL